MRLRTSTKSLRCDVTLLQADPLPRALQPVSGAADPLSSTLFIHYVMSVARQQNVGYLLRLLPLAANHFDVDVIYSDATLHELVSYLAAPPLADSFANNDLCEVVFDKFFLVRNRFFCIEKLFWGMPN